MNKILMVLSITLLTLWGGNNLKADDSSNGTIQSSVLNKYVDTDGLVYYDKPVIQTEFTYALGSKGFYLDIWDSQALNGKRNFGDEIETSLGWSHDGAVSVDVGISYYDILPLFKGPKGDVYVAYAKLSKSFDKGDFGTWKPFVMLTGYKTGRGSDYSGGARVQGGVSFSKTVGKTTFEATTALTKDDGTFDDPPAWVGSQSLDLSWNVKKVSLKLPILTAYTPLSGHSGRQSSVVVGANIAYNF